MDSDKIAKHDEIAGQMRCQGVDLTWHNTNFSVLVEGPEIAIRPVGPSDRLHRRTRMSLKEIWAAMSDRGRGVRSRGERPPTRGAPNHRR